MAAREAPIATTLALFLALGCAGAAAASTHDVRPPTTVERTIVGDTGGAYSTLRLGPGWSRVVRTDLAQPAAGDREARRRSLFYFAQFTDFQLADEESPARVEFLDADGTPATAAWRPQEALVPQVVDQAVRQVNEFDRSPVRDASGQSARLDLAITTGDSADNQQRNEVQWVVRLLEGGSLNPNSGVESALPCAAGPVPAGEAARYTGVQDFDDYAESGQFYDPDQPAGRYAGWPRWPGLMDRAQQPFQAAGLDVPSYVAFGNHDGLVQGNAAANAAFDQVAQGCAKVFAPIPLQMLGSSAPGTTPGQAVAVPPDPERGFVDREEYRAIHAAGDQPDAHGFGFVDAAEMAASAGSASYYSWSPRDGLRMIALNTVSEGGVIGPSAEGNIDDAQFRWLVRELDAAEARDELVILYGHHPIRSLTSQVPDEVAPPCVLPSGADPSPGCDRDPRSSQPIHLGADLRDLLLSHPHVIAYVAGHTHEHKITPFARAGGGGFWGIETSSEVDWPIQSRLLEVMDNDDGTLSIFGTLIDHGGAVSTPAPGTAADAFAPATLASIARELSFNDSQAGGTTGIGAPGDRNVELLLPDPRG